jgi:hypothetical protein
MILSFSGEFNNEMTEFRNNMALSM